MKPHIGKKKAQPVKTLTERDVIRMMREAWEAKVQGIVSELDTHYKQADGEKKLTVSPGLKIRHESSGLLYTVDTLGTKDVVLITPDGSRVVVNFAELDKSYALD